MEKSIFCVWTVFVFVSDNFFFKLDLLLLLLLFLFFSSEEDEEGFCFELSCLVSGRP